MEMANKRSVKTVLGMCLAVAVLVILCYWVPLIEQQEQQQHPNMLHHRSYRSTPPDVDLNDFGQMKTLQDDLCKPVYQSVERKYKNQAIMVLSKMCACNACSTLNTTCQPQENKVITVKRRVSLKNDETVEIEEHEDCECKRNYK
ncbi:uncharacterized protein LOC123512611 [Portunus trituberculatus]|uniref:uncharacterized protein LOC123512611 n=1 Tax=Portunus trituberculatus TaxID=210409 RepID=UPI001E1CF3B5|nr:uncharacterized protein LOC123512611 [Portunus trituberculatus]